MPDKTINTRSQWCWFVLHISFPFSLFRSIGSGKTRVLTSRIAYLLKHCQVKPYEIFAVTFTNKAALEMRHRISQMLPGVQLNEMWLGTFHGLGKILSKTNQIDLFEFLANRFLRIHCHMAGLEKDFIIIDPDDQLAIVKRILKDEIKEQNFYSDKPKVIINYINKCKDDGKRAFDILSNRENRFQKLVYEKYEKYIQGENKMDFGELILLTKGEMRLNGIRRIGFLLKNYWKNIWIYANIILINFDLFSLMNFKIHQLFKWIG